MHAMFVQSDCGRIFIDPSIPDKPQMGRMHTHIHPASQVLLACKVSSRPNRRNLLQTVRQIA
ncbi:hypothetical protein GCM10011408_07550 [Dyella caseinilytica]|nr:hypothetical protein GCM10011408_07550 [Dyella caseinilytica]